MRRVTITVVAIVAAGCSSTSGDQTTGSTLDRTNASSDPATTVEQESTTLQTAPVASADTRATSPETVPATVAPTTTVTAQETSSVPTISDAESLLGSDELELLRCSDPTPPVPGAMGSVEFSCTGDGGGPGFVVLPEGSTLEATVQAYMERPDFNPFGSTFLARSDRSYFVYAPSDFDFWGEYPFESASFFDAFDAVDTDCLDPATNDPLLCG